MKGRKNAKVRQGDMLNGMEHGRYCEFHDSKGDDTIKYTMLRRELETKIQFGQLIDLIKGLRSKKLEKHITSGA